MEPLAICCNRSAFFRTFCRGILIALLILGCNGDMQAAETCNSCNDCSAKLSTPGNQVTLTQNITSSGGNCITIQAPRITFDGSGHTISGNNTGQGIINNGYDAVEIMNCRITNFDVGIHLLNLSQNTLLNNLITYTQYGILLEAALDNTLEKNTVHWGGNTGIRLSETSTGNRLTFNESCSSIEIDLRSYNVNPPNTGARNTCDTVANWNDEGKTGCAYRCNLCGDYDQDGVCDAQDNCIYVYNPDQKDTDGDGIGDACDNCPTVYNPKQENSDLDNFGDACDNCWLVSNNDQGDSDNDCALLKLNTAYWNGTKWLKDPHCGNYCDNCPQKSNPDQLDTDGDGVGDICDNCKYLSNPTQADFDNDGIGDLCDNCWMVYNPDQKNTDGDNYGDACDKCPNRAWASNTDSDGDGVGDACDNCPNHPNPNQEDINNNGIGDACDCFDVFHGPNEVGVDCGGVCNRPCIPCTWCNNNVVPIRITGGINQKMDIVFVPDQTYQGRMTNFVNDVHTHIRNGFFHLDQAAVNPVPGDYKDRFNFYYYTGGYGYVDSSNRCKFDLPGITEHNNWLISCQIRCAVPQPFGCLACGSGPHNYDDDALFSDVAMIISNSGGGCSHGLGPRTSLSSDIRTNVVMHETGHALFGLVDEYCGSPIYWQVDPYPNVWESFNNCQNDANAEGWTLGTCRRIEGDTDKLIPGNECQADAWRYDHKDDNRSLPSYNPLAPDFMIVCGSLEGGLGGCTDNYRFYEADTRRINHVLNQFSSMPQNGQLMESLSDDNGKGLLMYLNINGGKITPFYSKILNGYPNIGLQEGPFLVEVFSQSGDLLFSFKLWDPRIRIGAQGGPGMVFTDNVNFSIAFPYTAEAKTVQIKDKKTHDLLLTVDITESLKYWRYVFLPLTIK